MAGALSIAAPRGKVSLFAGFPSGAPTGIDPNLVHYRELQVTGSSNSTVAEYGDALSLITSGRVERQIADHPPISGQ